MIARWLEANLVSICLIGIVSLAMLYGLLCILSILVAIAKPKGNLSDSNEDTFDSTFDGDAGKL
ncbi:hypothetical protein [Nostoc sp.]|uniref:hypothetical protein n=1 Tax=Nostoc sp. TaxID=1180 RepID=UPI002FF61A38